MKVLLVGPFPFPMNGCSYANEVLKRNLIQRNINCDCINTSGKDNSSKQGSEFSFVKTLTFLKAYLKLYKVFSNDILYLTPGQTFFGLLKYSPFILMCLIQSKPYVIHLHGNFLGKQYSKLIGFRKKVFHFLISKASGGIVLSKSLKNNFQGLLPDEKIFVVENFVEDSLIQSGFSEKKTDKLRILFLSNLMREKGIIELLDALIELQVLNIDFEASIAGSIELEIRDEVNKRFQQLSNRIQYLGTITGGQKMRHLLNANIFILPTRYEMEGQPISILEGLATGNIIIATHHAGIPDVISNKNGFLLDEGSIKNIVACFKKINLDLPNYISKFSSFNCLYARERFAESSFSDKIINIFNEVSKS